VLLKERVAKVKNYLFARKQAYQIVFSKDSIFAEKVLMDLAKFCRANETTFHADARLSSVLEGRREVWLRIQHHLQLDPELLWEKYGRKDLDE